MEFIRHFIVSDWPLPFPSIVVNIQQGAEQLYIHSDTSGRFIITYSELIQEPVNTPTLGGGSLLTFNSQPLQLKKGVHTIHCQASPTQISLTISGAKIKSYSESHGSLALIKETDITVAEVDPAYEISRQAAMAQHNKLTLKQLSELARNQPNNAQALFNYATSLAAIGEHAKARPLYERARLLYPTYSYIHNNLATTLIKLKEYELAYEALKEALEIDKENPEALHNIGLLLRDELAHLERFDESRESFKESIRIRPVDYRTRVEYAVLLAMRFPTHASKIDEQLSYVLNAFKTNSTLLKQTSTYLQERGVMPKWVRAFAEQASAASRR